MNQAIASSPLKPLTLFAQCAALVGFAFAQPLYDLLGSNPTFFTAHHASTVQVLCLVLGVSLVLPLLLTGVVIALGRLSVTLGYAAWLTLAGLLVALVLLPPTGTQVPGWPLAALAIALVAGTLFAWALHRFRAVRLFLTALSIAALLFALTFATRAPVRGAMSNPDDERSSAPNNGAPVVMIVFDEMPLTALMTAEGTINRNRYPAFAALADTAHWFRNASTVSYFTDQAVPAILSGLFPVVENSGGKRPTVPAPVAASFPRNLFSLLANSHDIHAFESITQMAPRHSGYSRLDELSGPQRQALFWLDTTIIHANIVLPEGLVRGLPGLNGQWLDFANVIGRWTRAVPRSPDQRADLALRFIDSLKATSRPPLYFLHVELPHLPLVFLPSGKYYGPQPLFPHGMTKDSWNNDSWEAVQGYQRFLLQLGYVDRLLGEIVGQLKATGLYDDALLIVTGDHGQSYREGTPPRRISNENRPDTLLVPLLIKLPGQTAGQVSDRNAEAIDILPTIAAALDSEPGWVFDGVDLLSAQAARNTKTVISRKGSVQTFPAETEGVQEALARKRSLFGSDGWDGVYEVGPAPALVWRNLDEFTLGEPATLSVVLERASVYRSIDTDQAFLPAFLRGAVTATSETGRPELVIALNGTIAATTWTYGDNASVGRFTAALPERLFRNGANRLDVLQLVSGPGGTILHPVQIEHEDRKINLGQALDFRRGRLDDRYLIGGLARPEKEYTWSNAVFVQFEFEVRDARGDIVLHAQVAPYLANGLIPEQVIDIRVDGEPVGAWVLDQPELGEQTIVIPERLITGGNFLLEFRIPRAAEPRVLGQGEDRRLLGLQFRSLWFSSDAD